MFNAGHWFFSCCLSSEGRNPLWRRGSLFLVRLVRKVKKKTTKWTNDCIRFLLWFLVCFFLLFFFFSRIGALLSLCNILLLLFSEKKSLLHLFLLRFRCKQEFSDFLILQHYFLLFTFDSIIQKASSFLMRNKKKKKRNLI